MIPHEPKVSVSEGKIHLRWMKHHSVLSASNWDGLSPGGVRYGANTVRCGANNYSDTETRAEETEMCTISIG